MRLFVKEVQRTLAWKEEGTSLVVEFRVEAQDLFGLICGLGTTANATFTTVGSTIQSTGASRATRSRK